MYSTLINYIRSYNQNHSPNETKNNETTEIIYLKAGNNNNNTKNNNKNKKEQRQYLQAKARFDRKDSSALNDDDAKMEILSDDEMMTPGRDNNDSNFTFQPKQTDTSDDEDTTADGSSSADAGLYLCLHLCLCVGLHLGLHFQFAVCLNFTCVYFVKKFKKTVTIRILKTVNC